MKRREVLYAVIGGVVGAVLVMAAGSFTPLGAQSQSDSFGEITCTGLKVVDSDGRMRIGLSATSSRGSVVVFGKEGFAHVGVDKYGGLVTVRGKDGERSAQMAINENGGAVSVHGRGNTDSRAVMGVNEYGNGAVNPLGTRTAIAWKR